MHTAALPRQFARRAVRPTPPRVLVVDDEPDIRDAHAALLRAEGWEVETARDGEQALVLLAFSPFDLLVTDWHMPRLDGASLVRWLRTTQSPLPVVMITGSDALSEVPASIRSEIEEILPKPVSRAHLIAVLRRILGFPAEPPPALPKAARLAEVSRSVAIALLGTAVQAAAY